MSLTKRLLLLKTYHGYSSSCNHRQKVYYTFVQLNNILVAGKFGTCLQSKNKMLDSWIFDFGVAFGICFFRRHLKDNGCILRHRWYSKGTIIGNSYFFAHSVRAHGSWDFQLSGKRNVYSQFIVVENYNIGINNFLYKIPR